MIINIRGTGGSGKSTLVRDIMSRYEAQQPTFVTGRKQPIGYRLDRPDPAPSLWVVGHYETPCGGGDTIKTPDEVYAQIESAAFMGCDVLFEGIIAQDDTKRCIAMAAQYPTLVLALDVPIEVCLASIQARRDMRGDVRPLNPANTVNREKRLHGTMTKLAAAGVDARWVSRDEALRVCIETLALGAPLLQSEAAPLARLF